MDGYLGDRQDPLSLHKYLYCADNSVNLIDPSGKEGLAELVLDMSIRVSVYVSAITPYAVYGAAAAGTIYLVTSTAIAVDQGYFGGTHTDSLYTLNDASGQVFFIAAFVAEAKAKGSHLNN